MTTPVSPLDKKVKPEHEVAVDETKLTLEERVGRLEIAFENAFNALAKMNHETEMRAVSARNEMEGELSKTLTIMNLSALQNIVTLKEVVKQLVEKKALDQATLEEAINVSLKDAIEKQQAAMQAHMDSQTEVAPV